MVDAAADQGDILKVEGIASPVLVVSKTFFNQSGMAICCPIATDAAPGPLHIEIGHASYRGIVLCEYMKLTDLRFRGYKKAGAISLAQIMDISDAIQGIFEYI